MRSWIERLGLPLSLGIGLAREMESPGVSLDLSFEIEWPRIGPPFEKALSEAFAFAIRSFRRLLKKKRRFLGGLFPTFDKDAHWLESSMEPAMRDLDPKSIPRLLEDLERLEGVVRENLSEFPPEFESIVRGTAGFPDQGEKAASALRELGTRCDEELLAAIVQGADRGTPLASALPRRILSTAIVSAMGRIVEGDTALTSVDPRREGRWFAQCEGVLARLAQGLQGVEEANPEPPDPERRNRLRDLARQVRRAAGFVSLLRNLPEVDGDKGPRLHSLEVRLKDLRDRIRVLEDSALPPAAPRPATDRQPRRAVPGDLEKQRSARRIALVHLWRASSVYLDKGAFSMAASFALSTLFVLLSGLAFLAILIEGIEGGRDFEGLLFRTVFPARLEVLVETTHHLVDQVTSEAELWTLLAVLFTYFALSLLLSLASNLNFLFGISSTHSFLDLAYIFGIFFKGFVLRMAAIVFVVALALGGYLVLIQHHPVFANALLRVPISVVVLSIVTVILLPLDDVPLSGRFAVAFVFAWCVPLGNRLFDILYDHSQSYQLLLAGAPVALATLWLYFGWAILLFLLALLFSVRDQAHAKEPRARPTVYLEVLRLAPTEPTFDELVQKIGAPRSVVHEVVHDLVRRELLQRFSPGIKPTAYTGGYHYRIKSRLDYDGVVAALLPEFESSLHADVPVEYRLKVAELRQELEKVVRGHLEAPAPVSRKTGKANVN